MGKAIHRARALLVNFMFDLQFSFQEARVRPLLLDILKQEGSGRY